MPPPYLDSMAVSWTVLKIPSTESGMVDEKHEIGRPRVDPKLEHTGLAGQIQFAQNASNKRSSISGRDSIVAAVLANRRYMPRGDSSGSK